MFVISLGIVLFDVFIFIWWLSICVIYLFYLLYGGIKKKIMNFVVVEEYVCEDVYVFCLLLGFIKISIFVVCLFYN